MVTYLNQYLALRAVALLVLGLSGPAVAHNGAVAIAVPVEGIAIDGDLSDWPEGLVRYPVALHVYGDKPEGGRPGRVWVGVARCIEIESSVCILLHVSSQG